LGKILTRSKAHSYFAGKKIGDYPNAGHNRELYNFEIDPKIKDMAGEIIIFTSPENLHIEERM